VNKGPLIPVLREAPVTPIQRVDSASLLGKAGVLMIEHQGQTYQLKLTRFGKLILTK
jgi:hemin uptake protein HemP